MATKDDWPLTGMVLEEIDKGSSYDEIARKLIEAIRRSTAELRKRRGEDE